MVLGSPDSSHHQSDWSTLAWSAVGSEIMFTSFSEDNTKIRLYVLDTTTGHVSPTPIEFSVDHCDRKLPCVYVEVAWSPGSFPLVSVCYFPRAHSECEMISADPETWDTREFLSGSRPQWIPRTSDISYECIGEDCCGTCVYSPEHDTDRVLTRMAMDGAWSPTGRYLASATPAGEGVGDPTYIELYDTWAGRTHRLYRNQETSPRLTGQILWTDGRVR